MFYGDRGKSIVTLPMRSKLWGSLICCEFHSIKFSAKVLCVLCRPIDPSTSTGVKSNGSIFPHGQWNLMWTGQLLERSLWPQVVEGSTRNLPLEPLKVHSHGTAAEFLL